MKMTTSSFRQGKSLRLTVIAVSLVVVLVISSLFWMLRLGHQFVTQDPPQALTTENIYFGTSGMVYKLNGRTGAVLWQEHIPTPVGLQIKVANGITYAMQDQNLYALNASNGRVIWHKTASAQDAYASMQIANNTVYIFGQFHTSNSKIPGFNFMALNARDGSLRWHNTTVNTGAGEFTVQHGAIYTRDSNPVGTVALDAATGVLRWHSQEMVGFGIYSTSVANGIVYDVAGNLLYARDEKSGQQLWVQQVSRSSDVFATPLIAGGVLYISSYEIGQSPDPGIASYEAHDFIHAFDAKTGTPVWTSAPGYQLFEHTPMIDGLLLAEYSKNGVHTFDALTAKDGKRRWQVTGSCQQRDCYAKAMVSQGTYYVFESKTDSMTVTETLTALDVRSGKKLSQRSIPSLYLYYSDVYQGIVYFMISKADNPNQKNGPNTSIYALELSTGVQLWQHAFDTQGESMNENNSFVAP